MLLARWRGMKIRPTTLLREKPGINRLKEVDGEDRAARIRDALAKARQETAEARQQNGIGDQVDLDQQYQSAEQEWQQAQAAEVEQESALEQAKAEGRFTAVAEQLKAVNPTAHQEITNSLGALDVMMQPEQLDVLRREMTKGDPRESLAVLHRLTLPNVQDDGSTITPEQKLSYLASLPPAALATTLSQARTYLQLEADLSKRLSRQYAGQPRKVSRAPAPFKSPRGGANPPQNLASLASKGESAADYIRARQQQIKRGRDDR